MQEVESIREMKGDKPAAVSSGPKLDASPEHTLRRVNMQLVLTNSEFEMLGARAREECMSRPALVVRVLRGYFLSRPYLTREEAALLRSVQLELSKCAAGLTQTSAAAIMALDCGQAPRGFERCLAGVPNTLAMLEACAAAARRVTAAAESRVRLLPRGEA